MIKPIKITRVRREAKRKREAELFAELSDEHGYTIVELKPKDRIGIMYDGVTGRMVTARYAKIAVPSDSWLAQSLDKIGNAAQGAKLQGLTTRKKTRAK
jgi:hypothetical protein